MDIDLGSFGDCRRQKAGSFLLDSLVKHGASRVNVRALGGNGAGELRITRFLCYPKVKPGVMFDTAAARTATLVRAAISWQYRPAPGLDPGDTTTLRDDGGKIPKAKYRVTNCLVYEVALVKLWSPDHMDDR